MTNDELLDKLEDMGAEVDDSLDRFMGDQDMYIQYLRKLSDNKNIIELRNAINAGDCDKAEKEIHSLKGVALNLGLLPLVDTCMDMLLDFRAGNNESAMAQIETVENCFREWTEAING